MLQHIILGLLRDGTPRHAYALASDYQRLSVGATYPANFGRVLRDLVDTGWVTPESNAPGDDERRKPFAITAQGAQAFDAWIASPSTIDEEFPTWLLFIEQVPLTAVDALLSRREDGLWIELKSCTRARDDALAAHNGNDSINAAAMQLRWKIMQISADLEFVRELRQELADDARPDPPRGRP